MEMSWLGFELATLVLLVKGVYYLVCPGSARQGSGARGFISMDASHIP